MRSAKVFGWGAVEQHAATWHPAARVEEIEPHLWRVDGPEGPLGLIGKDPWTPEEIQRRAETLPAASE